MRQDLLLFLLWMRKPKHRGVTLHTVGSEPRCSSSRATLLARKSVSEPRVKIDHSKNGEQRNRKKKKKVTMMNSTLKQSNRQQNNQKSRCDAIIYQLRSVHLSVQPQHRMGHQSTLADEAEWSGFTNPVKGSSHARSSETFSPSCRCCAQRQPVSGDDPSS